jgi:hypothetical protein
MAALATPTTFRPTSTSCVWPISGFADRLSGIGLDKGKVFSNCNSLAVFGYTDVVISGPASADD